MAIHRFFLSSSILYVVVSVLNLLLLVLYFVSGNRIIQVLSLASFVALCVIATLYFPYHLASPLHKIRRKIDGLQAVATKETLDYLKEKYKELYEAYLSLSESRKKQVYGPIVRIHETIENHLQAVKRLETLLQQGKAEIAAEEQQRYKEIVDLYSGLPLKEQEHFFVRVAHIKERISDNS